MITERVQHSVAEMPYRATEPISQRHLSLTLQVGMEVIKILV